MSLAFVLVNFEGPLFKVLLNLDTVCLEDSKFSVNCILSSVFE